MSTEKFEHTETESESVDDAAATPEVEIVETLETVEEEVVPEFEVLDETADEAVDEPAEEADEASDEAAGSPVEEPAAEAPADEVITEAPAEAPVEETAEDAAEETAEDTAEEAEAPEVAAAREVTKARARDLRTLIGKYILRHLPEVEAQAEPADEPERAPSTGAKALPYMRIIPWGLGLLFAFSFLWDFDGVTLQPFGYNLPLDGLLLIVSVSGLIGFFTNWLAITMLFHPRKRRPILGQGLIPAQRDRVIFRLAKAVSEELINEEIIKQKIEESGVIPKYRELALNVTHGVLEDPDFRDDLKHLTADYVDTVLGSEAVRKKIVDFTIQKLEEYTSQSLSGLAIKAYRFLNEDDFKRRIDQAVQQLPQSLDVVLDEMDHLLDRLPEKITERSEEIEEWATKIILGFVGNLDIHEMIITNMRKYDEVQLEALIKNSSNEQLNYIKYLGGALGMIGGLVIFKPLLALAVLGAIALILVGLDVMLVRMRQG